MPAKRQPGSNLGRATVDWNQAFLFYAGLPGERRSYQAVADEYTVSVRTVERHGCAGRWKEQARDLDRAAAQQAAERLRDERAAKLVNTDKLIDATEVTYAHQLRSGTGKATPADLARLHKLRTSLWELADTQSTEDTVRERPPDHIDPADRQLQ